MNSEIFTSNDRAPLADHCGIVAAYGSSDYNFFLRGLEGLRILQTRGYDGVGFVARTAAGIIHEHKGEGLIDEVMTKHVMNRYHDIRAKMWMYQVRYGTNGAFNPQNVQPLTGIHRRSGEPFMVVHNGQFSFDAHQEMETKSDTVVFVHHLAESSANGWDDRIVQSLTSARGAWSLAIGTNEGLYVSRDSFGFRPLVYGHVLDDQTKQYIWICASESSALENIGVSDFFEILPGTIAKVTDEGMKIISVLPRRRTRGLCIFENVYIHHGGSKVHAVRNSVQKIRFSPSVDDVRRRSGKILAREAPLSKKDVDIAIGIPGTGIEGGMSYARALGIPYFQAITDRMSTPEEKRTFMTADIGSIYEKVLQHFCFDQRALWGKRVVIVDDSMVRGNITKGIIYLLTTQHRVPCVHVRILCPMIDKPCHLGINTRSPDELIAARHNGNREDMCIELHAESLAFLSANGLREAITGNPRAQGFCMGCMVGQFHPIDKYGNEIGHRKRLKQNAMDLGLPATGYGKTHAYTNA